jgi:hypothetical protein
MKIKFKNFVKRSCGLHYIQDYVVREGSQGTNLQSKSIVTSCHAVSETAQSARVVSHFGESGLWNAQSFFLSQRARGKAYHPFNIRKNEVDNLK